MATAEGGALMSSVINGAAEQAAAYDVLAERSSGDLRAFASVRRLDSPRLPEVGTVLTRRLADEGVENFAIRFDSRHAILRACLRPDAIPSVTPSMVKDIVRIQGAVRRVFAEQTDPRARPVRYMVWSSNMPGIWNLGGDLRLFMQLIRRKDRERLLGYAHEVVRAVHANFVSLNLPLITVALVQGDALGGGFEAALTNDVIIAEEDAKFGLPEILFNMFPGMGAYSLLCRRLDGGRARQMITTGRLYEAEELLQMGLVDLVVPSGEGPAAVREYLARNQRRHNVLQALSDVYRRCQPVTRDELIGVTDIWVETALRLDEADLRRMERLATAQSRRWARAEGSEGVDAPLSAVG
jgi:DSF synthase